MQPDCEHTSVWRHLHQKLMQTRSSPSLENWMVKPLYFQTIVGGGELMMSQTISASSPSLNSCGLGAFWKVIFSAGGSTRGCLVQAKLSPDQRWRALR